MILFTIKIKPKKERKRFAPVSKQEKNRRHYTRRTKHRNTHDDAQ
jgi:hypothetical protein